MEGDARGFIHSSHIPDLTQASMANLLQLILEINCGTEIICSSDFLPYPPGKHIMTHLEQQNNQQNKQQRKGQVYKSPLIPSHPLPSDPCFLAILARG